MLHIGALTVMMDARHSWWNYYTPQHHFTNVLVSTCVHFPITLLSTFTHMSTQVPQWESRRRCVSRSSKRVGDRPAGVQGECWWTISNATLPGCWIGPGRDSLRTQQENISETCTLICSCRCACLRWTVHTVPCWILKWSARWGISKSCVYQILFDCI